MTRRLAKLDIHRRRASSLAALPTIVLSIAVLMGMLPPRVAADVPISHLVPERNPSFFTPYVGPTVADGARLALYLKKARDIAVVIDRIPAGTAECDPVHSPAAPLVGFVSLGALSPAGHVEHWSYRVNGKTLGPGSYQIAAEVFIHRHPSGLIAPQPYVFTIARDGRVNLNGITGVPLFQVTPTGKLTLLHVPASPTLAMER